jgi:thiol:disulfide interchange protein DsbD
MYSSLGIIAALSGGVFGGLTQNPIVYGVLIFIFLAMGASMMGAFDLQLPASWQGKLQGGQRKGAVGAMFMGAASGLIAAPCVGPILVALLTWVAKTGSVLVGFGLLFSYSVGMGMLFIVIGTFAGALTALPQAGQWMESVKHFFGWLLWGTAIFFAGLILPKSVMPLLWGAYLTLLGTYIGAFKPFAEPHSWKWTLGKWGGGLSLVTGLFFFVLGLSQLAGWPGSTQPASSSVAQASLLATDSPSWIVNDEPGAFAKAASEGKPLMMDFYADWCAACKELDHETYNQPEIISRSAGFISLKMDFTKQNDWSKQMTKKYGVSGMPTVIFFAADGKEVERFTGFKEAAEVAQIMDRVK